MSRATAAEIFEDLGFAVFDAYNGHHALALLEARPEIGLLFIDMRMPGMSGPELAEAVRRPSIRIVLTPAMSVRRTCQRASPLCRSPGTWTKSPEWSACGAAARLPLHSQASRFSGIARAKRPRTGWRRADWGIEASFREVHRDSLLGEGRVRPLQDLGQLRLNLVGVCFLHAPPLSPSGQ
jgi:hypothetical protein